MPQAESNGVSTLVTMNNEDGRKGVVLTIKSADSHATARADEGGKCLAVGRNKLTTLARIGLLLVEVEDEVFIVGQERKSISSASYYGQLICSWLGCRIGGRETYTSARRS